VLSQMVQAVLCDDIPEKFQVIPQQIKVQIHRRVEYGKTFSFLIPIIPKFIKFPLVTLGKSRFQMKSSKLKTVHSAIRHLFLASPSKIKRMILDFQPLRRQCRAYY
jgi:hypothetical protein